MAENDHPGDGTTIEIVAAKGVAGRFLFFFLEGVYLPVNTGGTLKEMICDQLGVVEEYFEERVQTIFLNFKAVDKPEKALVRDGAIIALSAAMPGLVGATMRKGGTYAALRSSISFSETDDDIEQHRGWITLKLLNMVARELGPLFFAKGVYVMDEKVVSLFKSRVAEFKNEPWEVILNGKAVSWEQVIEMKLSGKKVYFKVSARQ
jgi:hypothetical protein